MRQQVQPLPGYAAIVQPVLALELDVQLLLEVPGPYLHDGAVRILKHIAPGHFDTAVASLGLHCIQLGPEGLHFVNEVATSSKWDRRHGYDGVRVHRVGV